MSPRNDVSEVRKNQILEAAIKIFSEKGIHKARMSDIAEASGLSKGSLYWYFDSKDSMLLSLMKRVFEPELNDFSALLSDQRSAEERLDLYIDRVADDMIAMLKWTPLVISAICCIRLVSAALPRLMVTMG